MALPTPEIRRAEATARGDLEVEHRASLDQAARRRAEDAAALRHAANLERRALDARHRQELSERDAAATRDVSEIARERDDFARGCEDLERALEDHRLELETCLRDRDVDAAVAAARGAAGAEDHTESDAEKKGKSPSDVGADAPDPEANTASRAARVASFRRMLRERFLDGGDPDADAYARVDGDASLDESFAEVTARDAEEKYFGD